jgi:hypothetical protein
VIWVAISIGLAALYILVQAINRVTNINKPFSQPKPAEVGGSVFVSILLVLGLAFAIQWVLIHG